MSASRSACFEFLRHLEEHVAASREAAAPPAHVRECSACATRLRIASGLVSHLRVPPPIPRALQAPQFLESIHERVVEAMTVDRLGTAIVSGLSAVQAPAAMPWPLQHTEEGLEQHLRGASARTPGWVRHLVMSRTRRPWPRRAAMARMLVAAAMVALLAVLGWKSGRAEGTPMEVQIVIVPVPEMPSVLHPAAVLRLGGIR